MNALNFFVANSKICAGTRLCESYEHSNFEVLIDVVGSFCVRRLIFVSDREMGAPVFSTKPRRGTDCQSHSYNEALMDGWYNYPVRLKVCDQAWLHCIALHR